MKRHDSFYVYMIQDKNGTYYSGYAKDLENRFDLHVSENGAKYLRGRVPVEIAYAKAYRSKGQALRAEARIKTPTVLPRPLLGYARERSVGAKLSVGVTSKSL